MAEQVIRVSDLSGQRIDNPDEQSVRIVVTAHPGLEADQQARLEALPGEVEAIGKAAIKDAIVLDMTLPGEEGATRHVMRKTDFDKLPTKEYGKSMDEIVAAAAVIKAVVSNRARRSHNTTSNGGPLVNYNEPDNAGLPHKGKIGDKEAAFVRQNLQLVNQRRAAVGQPPIDPTNPLDARRYGFDTPTVTP